MSILFSRMNQPCRDLQILAWDFCSNAYCFWDYRPAVLEITYAP